MLMPRANHKKLAQTLICRWPQLGDGAKD